MVKRNVNLTKTDFRKLYQEAPAQLEDAPSKSQLVINIDIPENKIVKDVLDQSMEQYRVLFEKNPCMMMICDAETLAFLTVNDAAVHHYGYTREEFLAMTIKEIRPPEEVPALLAMIQNGWNNSDQPGFSGVGIWTHRKKDGTLIKVEITVSSITFKGKSAKLALVREITP